MNDLFAALDLGSNSFHLLLARRTGDGFETVERLKEKVQLLAGFEDGRLEAGAMARGEACLARFAQRLTALPAANIRMVGTHALREAANRDRFAARAEAILGVPLEVVSGEEEARLVFLGVARHVSAANGGGQHGRLPTPLRTRLVIDVGGGSTELAWSRGSPSRPDGVASYKVGCVSLRDWCFTPDRDQATAYLAARERAMTAFGDLTAAAEVDAIGTSGTVESVQQVLAANGWGSEAVTREGLGALTDAIVSGRWLVDAGLPGLAPERLDIFPAGLAVVEAAFRALGLESLRFVDASLQDGLLYRELDFPDGDEDLRDRAVAALQHRFQVDREQARRVRDTALALFDDTAPAWWPDGARWRDLLRWAAELHELGMIVAPRHYHRHGAYLLQNSDLRAFSQAEQQQLSLLLRGHRRAFPGLAFRAWDADTRRSLTRTLALLRIAVIAHRGHADGDGPALGAAAAQDELVLRLPPGWLESHPLSSRELEVEISQLAGAGIRLSLEAAPPPTARSS